mgnify:CR=1 FL=1
MKNLDNDTKRIISRLYLIGMSKDNIYKTLKSNGIKVPRAKVRNYLSDNTIRGRFEGTSKYLERYSYVDKNPIFKNNREEKRKEKRRLNKQYLQSTLIILLSQDKIKYKKKYKKLVKYDDYFKTWRSP